MATRRDQSSGRIPRVGVPIPLPVQALVIAARRHHLLDDLGAKRLVESGVAAGITQPSDWLPVLDQLIGIDAAALRRLLPKGDDLFGTYRPLAHLANGGMGVVWLTAAADGLNLAVLKHTRQTADSTSTVDERMRRRFAREAGVHRHLHHPNILRCLDVGISSLDQCYLVLEYIAGGDLTDLVERHGTLPEAVVLSLIYQVVDGLSEAHRLHLIHRDIKPGNVFITADGAAKLSDFGIVRKDDNHSSQLTMSGTVLGSPFYMSPEQVNGESDIDARCDIYGIGGLLCYCLSGHPPYPGKAIDAMRQHVTAPLPDLRREGVSLSEATAAIIARCLAKDRQDRYPDAMELRADLARARAEAGDVDVGSWMRGDSLSAVMDLNQTFNSSQLQAASQGSSTPLPQTSAILFREPEVITALLAARDASRHQQDHSTGIQQIPPVPPMSSPGPNPPPVPYQRPATEPLVPHWLVLAIGDDQERAIHLYGGPNAITLGKMAKPPIDITTLLYPIDHHNTANNRISRSHCRLELGPLGYVITDLNTSNGTVLNGTRLSPNNAVPISAGATLSLAQEIHLTLTPVSPRSIDASPLDLPDSSCEALLITRRGNRPHLFYAMVSRSLFVGGPGSDLMIPGFPAGCGLLVVWTPTGWFYRLHIEGRAPGNWDPLAVGRVIGQGSQRIHIRLGDYAQLTS